MGQANTKDLELNARVRTGVRDPTLGFPLPLLGCATTGSRQGAEEPGLDPGTSQKTVKPLCLKSGINLLQTAIAAVYKKEGNMAITSEHGTFFLNMVCKIIFI